MTVNHSSALSSQYFQAYFRLVMNSREFNVNEAKQFIEGFFFKNNQEIYGDSTYNHFLEAYRSICCPV